MKKVLKGALIINEGKAQYKDILITNDIIEKIDESISPDGAYTEINFEGKIIVPGCIDDQVHFREPGLTHKANIHTESMAAVAGGITTFMEMPNTVPNTLTQELLADKYALASKSSVANYSFFMGASNDNLEEVLKTNLNDVCGVKIFMGSSTGNMLVDKEATLDKLFSEVNSLIAVHCEDEATVQRNLAFYKEKFNGDIPIEYHPIIRSEEACYISSSSAVNLAKKHNTRLHILHISTEKETGLFDNSIPLAQKRITAEACVHHLWFTDQDYAERGNFIKWNPAVKAQKDKDAVWKALLDGRIDVLATDHAPHTLEEKSQSYMNAPSGGPLVQHALLAMLQKVQEGMISIEQVVEKMAHNPAILFQIDRRGYLREGYYADLCVIDPKQKTLVDKQSLLYKCGWSPFEGITFDNRIVATFVNGHQVYDGQRVDSSAFGQRILFNR